MPITAQFDFDEREHRKVLREEWRLHPLSWVLTTIGIAWPAIGLWLGVGRNWGDVGFGDAVFNAMPWLLLGGFFIGLPVLLRHVQASKALEFDPSLNGTQLRTVDEVGLHVVGAGYSPSLTWTDLQRATETKNFFLFFQDKRVWHYIPKRVLSDVERDAVRNLIQAYAPEMGRPALAAPAAGDEG